MIKINALMRVDPFETTNKLIIDKAEGSKRRKTLLKEKTKELSISI